MGIFSNTRCCKDFGLLIIRVGLGIIFIMHGYPKIMGGSEQWVWLGNQMGVLGIQVYPTFWGFLAACAELFGGVLLVLGLGTRIAAFFIGCVVFVATMMHYMQGDAFGVYSHPLALLIVFVGLIFAGSGKYSFDAMLP